MPKQNSPMNMICTLAFVTAAAGMCSANNANAQYGPPDAPAPMTYSERAGHNAPGWITQSEADQRTSQGQIHCGAGGPTLADGRENPLSQRWMDRRICDAIMAVDDSPRESKSYRIQHCTTVLEQRKLPHGIDHLKFCEDLVAALTPRPNFIEQDNAEEAKRQQQAGPGRRIIYAIFQCISRSNQCEMMGAPRVTFAGVTNAMTFQTLADCHGYIIRIGGAIGAETSTDGRFWVLDRNGRSGDMWLECRGRQIETWEPMR